MAEYFKGMNVNHYDRTIVIHFDGGLRDGDPQKLEAFLGEFCDECRHSLHSQLMAGPTYREWMSQRIKRGIKAAKERRKQSQQ